MNDEGQDYEIRPMIEKIDGFNCNIYKYPYLYSSIYLLDWIEC